MQQLSAETLANARVLVVGDVMLDAYLHSAASRISPEAPVPVAQIEREEFRAGGAANVAVNIAALGAQVELHGLIGDDGHGSLLQELLRQQGVAVKLQAVENHQTIVKKRVIAKRQQLLRIDYESQFSALSAESLLAAIAQSVSEVDVVVLSDYGKGTLSCAQKIIALASAAGKPVLVDPKGDDFNRYRGATLITPNYAEFEQVVGHCANDQQLESKALQLMQNYELSSVLVTKGERGMSLLAQGQSPLHLATVAREVYDVTGAGDTVIATLAALMAADIALPSAVSAANTAAGLVVAKFGSATLSLADLRHALQPIAQPMQAKIFTELDNLLALLRGAQSAGKKLVVTNGCFDLLHPGHIDLLQRARALGDLLVVLVNDDASVAALKGAQRPITPLQQRMTLLAALESVDYLCPFSSATPQAQIEVLNPAVLVKGGDYRVAEVAGSDHVLAAGGQVEIVPLLPGYSTTALIEKIRGH